jgi:hypothetical protein
MSPPVRREVGFKLEDEEDGGCGTEDEDEAMENAVERACHEGEQLLVQTPMSAGIISKGASRSGASCSSATLPLTA